MNRYIEKKHVIHTFSPDHVPTVSTRPEETLIFETYDCHMGQLLREGSDFDHMDKSLVNPAIGPIYIEGAYSQDMLRPAIGDIELDQVGILDKGPTAGALKERFPRCIIRRLPMKDGMVHYGYFQIPVRPIIDVISTASKGHTMSTLTPGDHGGNMDCTNIGPDTVLYLPVRVPGALLAMGDLHTVVGDGEYGNYGVGTGGRVTVQVDVIKNHPIPWPLVKIRDRWIAIAPRENVDEVCQEAVDQMFTLLTAKAGLSKLDAGMPIDILGNLVVCQIVNPQKTIRLGVSEWPLEKLGFYGLTDQKSITRGLKGEQEVRS